MYDIFVVTDVLQCGQFVSTGLCDGWTVWRMSEKRKYKGIQMDDEGKRELLWTEFRQWNDLLLNNNGLVSDRLLYHYH